MEPRCAAVDQEFDKLSLGHENGFLWDVVNPESSELQREDALPKSASEVGLSDVIDNWHRWFLDKGYVDWKFQARASGYIETAPLWNLHHYIAPICELIPEWGMSATAVLDRILKFLIKGKDLVLSPWFLPFIQVIPCSHSTHASFTCS